MSLLRRNHDSDDTPLASPSFLRVLDPADPWIGRPSDTTTTESFRGRVDWNISVAMESRCDALTVVAALFGARREAGCVDLPTVYRFTKTEVDAVGGELEDTDANPPWPSEYNEAHHDIVSARDEVASEMARLHLLDANRVNVLDEMQVLERMADLLGRDNVHKKFKKGCSYRFNRMFDEDRSTWVEVARAHRHIGRLKLKEIRKLYNDKTTRVQWTALMDQLSIDAADRKDWR